MVAIVLVAGLLTSACGTTSRQVQPTAADLQTIKRLAVVVTGDDPFGSWPSGRRARARPPRRPRSAGPSEAFVGGLLGYAIGGGSRPTTPSRETSRPPGRSPFT